MDEKHAIARIYLFYIYFRLMDMMLDRKQIQAIFLFQFKMGHKAVERTCNINKAFGLGAAHAHTVQ